MMTDVLFQWTVQNSMKSTNGAELKKKGKTNCTQCDLNVPTHQNNLVTIASTFSKIEKKPKT